MSVIEEVRGLLTGRLSNLNDEKRRVERAIEALGTTSRRLGRPRGSTSTTKVPRRRRSGTRADQAVALIEGKPGISASEVAKMMKIKPNYLYRVLGDLKKAGRVKEDGSRYNPA